MIVQNQIFGGYIILYNNIIMNEEWELIGVLKGINYEWRYAVSNLWRMKKFLKPRRWIKKNYTEKIVSWSIVRDWYNQIALWKNNKQKKFLVHRLVAKFFLWLEIENESTLVCHYSEELIEWKLNNSVSNIWIGTHRQNSQDMVNKKRHWHLWNFWKFNSHFKEVDQLSLNWEFIQTWDSQRDAERWTWIKAWNISTACSKWYMAGWYKWRLHK